LNLLFFGKFQAYNDFDLLLNFANISMLANDKNIKIFIVGSGISRLKITNFLEKNAISNVFVIDSIALSKLAESDFLTTRTVGLIPLSYKNSVSYLSPIKFYDYLKLGLPILISNSSSLFHKKDELYQFTKFYDSGNLISFINIVNEFRNEPFQYFSDIREGKFESFVISNLWKIRMAELINFMELSIKNV
jgi:hypothetical protein